MSWNGFVKAVSRATTSVMQSTGMVEKTVDRAFDDEEKRFRMYACRFEEKVEKLQKEAKSYLDAVRAMTLAQRRIAESVEIFASDSEMGVASSQYKFAVEKIDDEARIDLDNNYRLAVLEPIGKLISTFPDFNEVIKKRSKKLLDYDRAKSNVKKLVDRPHDDSGRLPVAERECNDTKERYSTLNNQLMSEIPKLIDMRVPYLSPSFEAIVKSQTQFAAYSFDKLEKIHRYFPDSSMNEGHVENILQQMKELTICKSG